MKSFGKLYCGLLTFACFAVTTSAALAQVDERQRFPQVSTMSPLNVDLQTGRFVKEGVDLAIGPLSVDHFLKTRGQGPFAGDRGFPGVATSLSGRTWYYESPAIGGSVDRRTFVQVGKQQVIFNNSATGNSFFPFDSGNTGWKMVPSGNNYILTYKSGDVYTFAPHSSLASPEKLLISKLSPDGHKITNAYDSSGRLKLVTSNRGYAVVLQYSGFNVIVCGYNLTATEVSTSSTCAASALKVTYGRNSFGQVTSITNLAGDVISLQYSGANITCVTLPNSSTCAVQNQFAVPGPSTRIDHVIQQTTANGEVWNYEHIPLDLDDGDYTPYFGEIRETYSTMTPPAGGITSATFGNGFLQSINTPGGSSTYEYSSLGAFTVAYRDGYSGIHYYSVYPSKITYVEGNSILFFRDYADNVVGRIERAKPGSGLADNGYVWNYPAANAYSSPTICAVANVLCDKPIKFTDANGNETDYTYDATHGGMLTETKPAVNGIRPQTRRSYVQRNAMIKSGATYVAMQPSIWVLASEEYCKTTAASGSGCAGGAADEVVTTYDYGLTTGPNNLLLRGTVGDSGGLNLRTCYTYDQYSRKIAETQPEGTGSICP